MAVTKTIQPTAYPISLAQAKRQLRVDGTDDDTYISGLIAVAADYCESFTSSQFVVATYRLDLERFPEYGRITTHYCLDDNRERIILPVGPVLDVTSITYKDSDGATQTWSSSQYALVTTGSGASIECKPGYTFPARGTSASAVTVTYRAGYARPFTANTVSDELTFGSSEPADLNDVFLSTTDGDLPAPLAINTAYDTNGFPGLTCTIRLANDAGDINITDTGTGTHFIGVIPPAAIHAMLLLISMWYTTRNSEMETNGKYPGIDYLLAPICWGGTYV